MFHLDQWNIILNSQDVLLYAAVANFRVLCVFFLSGDSLTFHNGKNFTTTDKDQDTHSSNCAQLAFGGYWYANCFMSNPNGIYTWGPISRPIGVHWRTFNGLESSLKTLVMKIRPVPS